MKLIKYVQLALVCLLAMALLPAAQADSGSNPEGTWLLTVLFPGDEPPPFQEFLVFHRDGTVSEHNSSLHANSAFPGVFNLNGGPGFGVWQRGRTGKVEFTFWKMVFCGGQLDPQTDFSGCVIPNQFYGYLRVRARAIIRGDLYIQSDPADAFVDLLVGTDPSAPQFVIPFGPSEASGTRLRVLAPY